MTRFQIEKEVVVHSEPGLVSSFSWEPVGTPFDSYMEAELARLEFMGKEYTRVTAVKGE